MRRTNGWLLVLALAGPGCLSSGAHVTEAARNTPPVQMAEAPPPPPPVVTPDEVTEANAAEKAQALAREMDYEPPAALATAEMKESTAKP